MEQSNRAEMNEKKRVLQWTVACTRVHECRRREKAVSIALKRKRGTAAFPQGNTEGVLLHENQSAENRKTYLDNAVLDEGLGALELVVRGVVSNVNDTSLGSEALASPAEVTGLEADGTVLEVATTATDDVNSRSLLRVELGHRGGTTEVTLALLLVDVAATTGEAALVSGVTRNACRM